jgi:hypothetical protein
VSATTLLITRGLYVAIGAGALLMTVGGVMGGESLADPPFLGGLALGLASLAAALWVEDPRPPRAVAAWLGIDAPVLGIAALGIMLTPTNDPSVIGLIAVPAVMLALAAARMTWARVQAGPLGRPGVA